MLHTSRVEVDLYLSIEQRLMSFFFHLFFKKKGFLSIECVVKVTRLFFASLVVSTGRVLMDDCPAEWLYTKSFANLKLTANESLVQCLVVHRSHY